MTLQLSSLQQHCLAGIGISTWQQHTPSSSEINEPVAEYALSTKKNAHVENNNHIEQHLGVQIETALNYVLNHTDNSFKWCVDEHSQCSTLVDDQLTLPTLPFLLSDRLLKKELWTLISGDLS